MFSLFKLIKSPSSVDDIAWVTWGFLALTCILHAQSRVARKWRNLARSPDQPVEEPLSAKNT
jgi:hypothetical protein